MADTSLLEDDSDNETDEENTAPEDSDSSVAHSKSAKKPKKNDWKKLNSKIKTLGIVGGFVLYLVGYLSLRFHLTTLGVGTDLAVLDEKYIFIGCQFFVYLLSSATIPILIVLFILLVVLTIFLILKIVVFMYTLLKVVVFVYRCCKHKATSGQRPMTQSAGSMLLDKVDARTHKTDQTPMTPPSWLTKATTPVVIASVGIVCSVLAIQLVLRQCFFFSNLLLEVNLPEPKWLADVILDDRDVFKSLYFSVLIATCMVVWGLFYFAWRQKAKTYVARFLVGTLGFLATIQLLFLPINYGIIVEDKYFPEVKDLGNSEKLDQDQKAWLVWEGKEDNTYFICHYSSETKNGQTYITCGPPDPSQPGKRECELLTVPHKDITHTRIIGYAPFALLLGKPQLSEKH